ncbi:hypothetical protein BASA62_002534 [Batrachochytrium salamandrivorans]|nr:hypothetical protein BASA62_002534 [Batrachochytrium salamandrivorans]
MSNNTTDILLPVLPALKPTQPRPAEVRRPRLLVAKRVPEDHFGKDYTYNAPRSKTVPLTLIQPNQHIGPIKGGMGAFVEHTVLGDVDDYADFERMYSKLSEKAEEDGDAISMEPLVSSIVEQISTHEHELDGSIKANSQRITDERKDWIKQLHIFQQYREMREEHALSNWKHHSVEWNRIEQKISNSTGKPVDELLMARLGEYREFVEERDLIEEALLLLEEQNVNFWKTGLRIGSDLLGLCFQMPRGGPRQMERLRSYELHNAFSKKIPSDYQNSRKQELAHIISHLDPFFKHGNGGYLEVVGHNSPADESIKLTKEYMARLDKRASIKSVQPKHESISSNQPTPDYNSQIPVVNAENDPFSFEEELVFSTKRMFFQVSLNKVTSSILTVYNRGAVTVHFCWTPIHRPNPLQTKATYDNVQRFYLSHLRGVILPGTAYDFPVIFKSGIPGLFTELWVLETSPVITHQEKFTITLQGLAIEEETYHQQIRKVEQTLDRRYAETVACETIEMILSKIKTKTDICTYSVDPNQLSFEIHNRDMKLRYQQSNFEQMTTLAQSTFNILGKNSCWDSSIANLYETMLEIPHADVRSQYVAKLNQLVHESSINTCASQTSIMSAICYDMFIDISGKICENSERLRIRVGLPLARPAAKFFDVEDGADDGGDKPADVLKGASAIVEPGKKHGALGGLLPNSSATSDAKRGATAPIVPNVAKDSKKGSVAAAPIKAADQTKKLGIAPKKPNDYILPTETEEATHQTTISKLATKKKFGYPSDWTAERHQLEGVYINEFRTVVKKIVCTSLGRLSGLFDDISMKPC